MGEYSGGVSPERLATSESEIYGYIDAGLWFASADPTVNDDTSTGFTTGSLWENITTGVFWRCVNPAEGAAIWAVLTKQQNNGAFWLPADAGYKAWNFDPNLIESNSTFTSGQVNYQRIRLARTETITGANLHVATAGDTLTAGQSLMALLNTSGTRLAISADQAADWDANTGLKSVAFTAPLSVAAGDYFVAFLSVGTTTPSLSRGQNTNAAVNGLLTTPLSGNRALRSTATNLTTIASSIDFAAATQAHGTQHWVALY